MGVLSGYEIEEQVKAGNIAISDFDPARCGPNSYDVSLAPPIWACEEISMDIRLEPTRYRRDEIPPEGYVLEKNRGYLAVLKEHIHCAGFVPWIDGRSTLGRYFVMAHVTAGRGDDGWPGHLTLEMATLHSQVRIYANIPIMQITFMPIVGKRKPYAGRYFDQPCQPRPPVPFK